MKQKNQKLIAESFGIAAFELGQPCIPTLDTNMMQMLKGLKPGEGAFSLMQSWHQGWSKANLATPVAV